MKRAILIKFIGSLVLFLAVPLFCVSAKVGEPSIEILHQEAKEELSDFLGTLKGSQKKRLIRYTWKNHGSLIPSERALYEKWFHLSKKKRDLGQAFKLKQRLIALHPETKQDRQDLQKEADQMAQEIIKTLSEYRKKWEVVRPALAHNFLVNVGIREKGFCWHWVELFLDRLRPLGLKDFELRWGVAHQGGNRENNVLVITPPKGLFDEGLAIDGWRESGTPFWRIVREDRFPWKELKDP